MSSDSQARSTIPVIHRDHTFEFGGRRYCVTQGSDQGTSEWDGYSIIALLSEEDGDEADIEDALHSMSAVRGYLARAAREGWPYLPNVDGVNPFDPHQEWILLSVAHTADSSSRNVRDPLHTDHDGRGSK